MSQVVSLVGNDTLQINDRVLLDLADGDVGALTFPNDIMGVKTGKNGNSLYAFNASGLMCELILRIIRGSDDDKYLNTLLLAMIADVPTKSPRADGWCWLRHDGNCERLCERDTGEAEVQPHPDQTFAAGITFDAGGSGL